MWKDTLHPKLWGMGLVLVLLISACRSTTVNPTPVQTLASPPYQLTEKVLPSESDLTSILKRMVDEEKRATGMVVGMIAKDEKVIAGYGSLNEPGGPIPDGDSLFEIGSISKVFIGTLLADAVRRGEVNLEDPASLYLPPTVRMPAYDGNSITLLDLVTHTSGLPKEISADQELTPENWVAEAYDFLSSYELTYEPGTKFVYSNIGMTVLAHILELRTGMDYTQLLMERILQPLKMTSTGFEPLPVMTPRLATGHNSVMHPIDTYVYRVPDHVYVGGIISSAEDMLRFASAAMDLEPSPLLPAFQEAVKPQRFGFNGKTGLAWLMTQGSYPIVYHNGHTLGMHAYFGFDPNRKIAVIVLANAAVPLDDIGPHLLYPSRYALERFTPRVLGTPVPVDPDILASYTGKYQFEDMALEIMASRDQLVLSIPDEKPFTLLPESNTRFVIIEYEASIRFLIDDGKVIGLLLDQAGASQIFTFKKVMPGEYSPVRRTILSTRIVENSPADGGVFDCRRL